jgi:hypothetical protein
MIQLTLGQALILYSSLIAIIAISIWIYTEFTIRRPQRGMGKQFMWRCTFCGYVYLDDDVADLSECPQCHSFVSSSDHGAKEGFAPHSPAPEAQQKVPAQRNTSHRKRHHARRRGPRKRR